MNLEKFQFGELAIRVCEYSGEPWFVARDVCEILEINNPRDTVKKRLETDEKGVEKIYTPGGFQNFTVINEPGLYNLIFRSTKPEAKQFKRWITHEVIPSIRKNGGYLTPDKTEEILSDPDSIIRLAENLKQERARAEVAEKERDDYAEHNRELQPKAQYHDEVLSSDSLIPTSVIAKDLGVGAQTLHKFLHRCGVIYKRGGIWMLYHKWQNTGIAHYKTFKQTVEQGGETVTKTRKHLEWTEKGQRLIHDLWRKYKAVNA